MLDHGTAIDISNYTGRLSGAQLVWLKQHCDVVIVRLSTEDNGNQREIAAQQVSALADAGIPWQGYLWAYWGDEPFDHWQRAKEKLPSGWPGYYGRNIWIDMEDLVTTASDALTWVMAYAEMLRVEDFLPGVYTGEWWVERERDAFRGPRADLWKRYPLWFARYGVKKSCTPDGTAPWDSVAMHQYQSIDVGDPLSSYDRSLICNLE